MLSSSSSSLLVRPILTKHSTLLTYTYRRELVYLVIPLGGLTYFYATVVEELGVVKVDNC